MHKSSHDFKLKTSCLLLNFMTDMVKFTGKKGLFPSKNPNGELTTKKKRTVSRTGTGTHQNFIIGCRYFLKMRRLYQTTGMNQQFFICCRYFSCFYLFVTL